MISSMKNITCLLILLSFIGFGCSETTKEEPVTKVETPKTAPAASTTKTKVTAAATPNDGTKQYYQSDKYGFKIEQPKNWELMESQMENVPVIFVNRPKGAFSNGVETISIAVENIENTSLEAYLDFSHQQLLTQAKGIEILEMSGGNSDQNMPFKRIIYNRQSNQKNEMTSVSFLYYTKNTGYVVTCSDLANRFEKSRPYFEQIGASMAF